MTMLEMKILQNQVHCNLCGDEPYSGSRHDFKYCECGNVAVDGGLDYLRRVGKNLGEVTEMSYSMPKILVTDIAGSVSNIIILNELYELEDLVDKLVKEILCRLHMAGRLNKGASDIALGVKDFYTDPLAHEICLEVNRMIETGRNAFGIFLGAIRVLKKHNQVVVD